jgi:NAD(P)-dependent dehydrogenase (short-subunit alcohol dehydrogenase family)
MNKVVLITGASRGIGAATAIAAADAGYHVGINYTRDERAAQEVAEQVRAKGVNAAIVKADVGNEQEIVDMFNVVRSELGAVTALVNNAGIILSQASVVDMDAARIERMLAVNVTGAFICAREAIGQMSSAAGGNGGAIVNVSSMAARLGAPFEYVDYAASKGAIDSFTIGLSKEVADLGIRVNAVRPGIIFTDIHATAGEPGRIERVAPSVPMRRGGQPHEVASAIMWLLSDEASYVTGSFIDTAGGR